ncbi:MAG: DnaA N-terminal domain-containing protein, partial [Acetobacter sp.]
MTIGVDDDESAVSRLENDKGLEESWLRICARLKDEVGEVEYRTWLTKIALGPIDGDEITLLLPTRFLRDWVRSQYGDRLSDLWHHEIPTLRRVELQVSRPGDPAPIPLEQAVQSASTTEDAPPS